MGTEFFDELEPRNGAMPPLPDDASLEDVIRAINGLRDAVAELAKASKSHGVELGGIRAAFHEQGTRIETFCRRIERALRTRDTDPPPPGEAT
jgi:hypothetical protein